jgi:GT2 family glycosyltransferase
VDGGSSDDTIRWCNEQPDITLIEHGELRGAIPAFCDGARAANGKYVILANDDVIFHENSVLYALSHLEDTDTCGAVAFADNRYTRNKWQVMEHPYRLPDGTQISGAYAQVGMYRRWLGDLAGWWGDTDPGEGIPQPALYFW